MIHVSDFNISKFKPCIYYSASKHEHWSDDIFTFDSETTSMFKIGTQPWQVFNDGWSKDMIDTSIKGSLVYIWMFSVNECVIYGRNLLEFIDFLDKLCDHIKVKFRIYVHNLAFDFQFIRKYIDFSKVFARKPRKPIFAEYRNCQFCCSYMLTRKSLAKCAENYTSLRKRSGDLDYNKLRTPGTQLTRVEKKYCEFDCKVLYHTIAFFREKYGRIDIIPLTQTGEVRYSFRQQLEKGDHHTYMSQVKRLVPSPDIQMLLRYILEGGDTHANIYHLGEVLENVRSFDKSSAHPSQFFLKKFPLYRFSQIKDRDFRQLKQDYPMDDYAYICTVDIYNIKPRVSQSYISLHRTTISKNVVTDNGRVFTADHVRLTCTEVDLAIINMCYTYEGDIACTNIYISKKERLPKELLDLTLLFYLPKTALKNIEGKELEYLNSKEQLNGIYGMCITDVFGAVAEYVDGVWQDTRELTNPEIEKKLKKQKSPFSAYNLIYQVGVWTPLYSRLDLWEVIAECGEDEVYHDTDCVHSINDHSGIIYKINDRILKGLAECEECYGYEKGTLSPCDSHGISHPLGVWEEEKSQKFFKTLGAKKYAVVTDDNRLSITVSGVNPRKAVTDVGRGATLSSLDDFSVGWVFDIYHSGRMISEYIDDPQTYIIDGKEYTQLSGICMYPSTYELGVTSDLAELVEIVQGSSHAVRQL